MPDVTIVMPAYNAARFLGKSVPAALAALRGGRLIVVDPGSDDDTPRIAEELGAEVVRLGHRAGPALARNRGVERVDTEVVLFIDSDCVCHPDVVERVAAGFADPELVSVMGSYDTAPPEPNFFSQYMNLRHHFVHQRGRREGAGFWAGCGAVRTAVFRRIGGFDADRYPRPMIEDIELGLRLRREGRTALDPELQVTHLKRWTLRGVVETEIFHRAIPWGKLILEQGEMPNDLNLARTQRILAALAPFVLLSAAGAPLAAILGSPAVGAVVAAPLVISMGLHHELIGFFARKRGGVNAALVFLFHQVHLTYSGVTMGVLMLRHLTRRRPSAVRADDPEHKSS